MPDFELASGEAWLWMAGSLLLAGLWTNLAWLFSPWVEAGRSPDDSESLAERIVILLASWRFSPVLFQGLRLLYYVALPFAALFWGYDAVISRFFGLQRLILPTSGALAGSASINANWLDWANDIGWAAALGLGSWALLMVAGWVRRRALAGTDRSRPGGRVSVWETLREALYHETHWAFYRSAPIETFGLYWGPWAGLTLAALEALINPAWRKGLRHPERAAALLLRAALAVISSLLFLRTQNLWLAILLHWGVASSLRALYPAPSEVVPRGAGTGM
jgi:hypothetical protein